mmetsp:Transcript_37411/g.87498  ORF Transcript_37411/g.87498 Transcript_37411/m.87498 type:complete len:237 (-) Transcript_37411:554-1264(-)
MQISSHASPALVFLHPAHQSPSCSRRAHAPLESCSRRAHVFNVRTPHEEDPPRRLLRQRRRATRGPPPPAFASRSVRSSPPNTSHGSVHHARNRSHVTCMRPLRRASTRCTCRKPRHACNPFGRRRGSRAPGAAQRQEGTPRAAAPPRRRRDRRERKRRAGGAAASPSTRPPALTRPLRGPAWKRCTAGRGSFFAASLPARPRHYKSSNRVVCRWPRLRAARRGASRGRSRNQALL